MRSKQPKGEQLNCIKRKRKVYRDRYHSEAHGRTFEAFPLRLLPDRTTEGVARSYPLSKKVANPFWAATFDHL